MICYPEKLLDEAVSLFQTRFSMHTKVYTHKAVKQIEFMICDALELADKYIKIPGTITATHTDGLYLMSQCVEDMQAFHKLTDTILDIIMLTNAPANDLFYDDLRKSQAIINRIRHRELYVCVGQTNFLTGESIDTMSEKELLQDMLGLVDASSKDLFDIDLPLYHTDAISSNFSPSYPSPPISIFIHNEVSNPLATPTDTLGIMEDDLIIEKMHIHYGSKHKNPVDRLRFFPKRLEFMTESNEVIIGRKVDESKYDHLLPRQFEKKSVRVFCRDPSKESAARILFERWCIRMDAHSPFPSSSQPSYL